MKACHNFYTELKEEFRQCAQQEGIPCAQGACDAQTALFEHLSASGQRRRLRKAAQGQSLTKASFDMLCTNAYKLAECVGLNLLTQTRGTTALIALSAPHLSLNALDDHLHVSRLLTLLSSADQLRFDIVQEDGEALLRLSMYYDLAFEDEG